jgi:hypothetical protein
MFKRFKPFKPPPHSFPATAGEDKGGGVERSAQKLRRRRISLGLRLNGLNVWNCRSQRRKACPELKSKGARPVKDRRRGQ